MENTHKPLDEITFADLRVHFGTGRAILVSGTGRDKVYRYRHGIMTDLGDLKTDEWAELAKTLIQRTGEQEMYAHLLEWLSLHNGFCRSPGGREQYALELHMSRIFDCEEWADFIPFNRQYRSAVLQKADIVLAKCTVCGRTQQKTRAQYQHLHACFGGQEYCYGCQAVSVMTLTENKKE